MPTVPTQDAPTISAGGVSAPTQAPPEAFGAEVLGNALKEVGGAVGDASKMLQQHALAFQDQQNQIDSAKATGDAYNQIYQAANEYRDNNQGLAAKNNLGDFYQKLEGIYNDTGASLNTAARIRYEAETRSAMRQVQGQTAIWASAQYKDATKEVFKGKLEGARNLLTASPSAFYNPDGQAAFKQAFTDYATAANIPQEEIDRQYKVEYTKAAASVAENLINSGQAAQGIDFFKKTDDSVVDAGLKAKALSLLTNKAKPQIAADIADNVLNSFKAGAAAHGTFGGLSGIVPPQYANVQPSSGFGAREAPTAGASTFHNGVDYPMPVGTPLRAPGQAVVEAAGPASGFGNMVKLKMGDGTEIVLGHLSNVNVQVGQTVNPGDLLGKSGNEGISTGPHLHVGVLVGGKPVDPSGYLKGQVPEGGPLNQQVTAMAQNFPAILNMVQQRAEAQFPGDKAFADAAVARVETEFGKYHTALNIQTADAFDSVTSMLANNPDIRDAATAAKYIPGFTATYNGLTGAQQKRVDSQMRGNANMITPERQQTYLQYDGELQAGIHGGNPAALTPAWAAKVLNDPNVPLSMATSLVRQQQAAVAKANDAQHQGQLQQSVFNQTIHSNTFKTALGPLGITDPNSPEYNTILGSVNAQVQLWTAANPNKKPTPKDLADITAQAVSRTSSIPAPYHNTFLGIPFGGSHQDPGKVNLVPDQDRQLIVQAYRQQYGVDPTEQEIARKYQATKLGLR